jgi:hypothetical protein
VVVLKIMAVDLKIMEDKTKEITHQVELIILEELQLLVQVQELVMSKQMALDLLAMLVALAVVQEMLKVVMYLQEEQVVVIVRLDQLKEEAQMVQVRVKVKDKLLMEMDHLQPELELDLDKQLLQETLLELQRVLVKEVDK